MGLPLAVARPGNRIEVTRLRESAQTGGATDSRVDHQTIRKSQQNLSDFSRPPPSLAGVGEAANRWLANTFTARALRWAKGSALLQLPVFVLPVEQVHAQIVDVRRVAGLELRRLSFLHFDLRAGDAASWGAVGLRLLRGAFRADLPSKPGNGVGSGEPHTAPAAAPPPRLHERRLPVGGTTPGTAPRSRMPTCVQECGHVRRQGSYDRYYCCPA